MIIQDKIYHPLDIINIIKEIKPKIQQYKNTKYFYTINAFDIEFSTVYQDDEPYGFMYVWQFCFDGYTIIGRTWDEFLFVLDVIHNMCGVDLNHRMLIFVHNLSVEFSYIRKYFIWETVKCNDNRKPIQAVTNTGFEFRCSYQLSGYSLKKLAEQLNRHTIKKLLGELDYNIPRNNKTVLTDDEISYCKNDVDIIVCYIDELLDEHRYLGALPLTKTGFVRKYCHSHLQSKKYKELIMSMKINDYIEYLQLRRAFQGGFTHANYHHVGKTLSDVGSYDLTSAYPAVMCYEMFPMSTPEYRESVTEDEFLELSKTYLLIADFEFTSLVDILDVDHIISESKIMNLEDVETNNGRIISMYKGVITATNVDFDMYRRFYTYDDVKIRNVRIYKKRYLPDEFRDIILTFYQDKNMLKNVIGREVEYKNKKAMLNSLFGMIVTDIIKDEYMYDTTWSVHKNTIDDYRTKINKYNTEQRILYYPWGVFITAYVRRIIFNAILELRNDYVYSDTDSVKILNVEKHKSYFEKFNSDVEEKLKRALGKKYERAIPNGKMLGAFDFEGVYKHFKTLGAKRYMYYKNGLNIVCSGLPKTRPLLYLTTKYETLSDIFDFFTIEGFTIPKQYTDRLVTYYHDEPYSAIIDGVSMTEQSGMALKPSAFNATLSDVFLDLVHKYIEGV